MGDKVAIIGFGEAGMTLAPEGAFVFDIRDDGAKLAEFQARRVNRCETVAEALRGARVILSLVTADQALQAATDYASMLEPGALWIDMNSVAPASKRAACNLVESAGARFVDAAIMAPVQPGKLEVPILLAGEYADSAIDALGGIGFTNLRAVGGAVGAAAAIKMIRSVIVKGMEALSAECAMAAQAAGVLPEVVASLDASEAAAGWSRRFDYNLDRMMVHGTRRAAEMSEVVSTLDALATDARMSRATMHWQLKVGALGLATPPPSLVTKLECLAMDCAA